MRPPLDLHRAAEIYSLMKFGEAIFMPLPTLMGPFANEMNAYIYEIFMPTLSHLFVIPHRVHLFATCCLGHADIDISELTLLSPAIPS